MKPLWIAAGAGWFIAAMMTLNWAVASSSLSAAYDREQQWKQNADKLLETNKSLESTIETYKGIVKRLSP